MIWTDKFRTVCHIETTKFLKKESYESLKICINYHYINNIHYLNINTTYFCINDVSNHRTNIPVVFL